MGAKIDQKMESKMECILASIFERFCWILGAKLGGKIDQKSHRKNDAKKPSRLGRVLGRLRAVKGAATYSDPVRRDPTRPNALEILPRRPPGPPPFRAKIPVKKETVLDVLTRLGPEAWRIYLSMKKKKYIYIYIFFLTHL